MENLTKELREIAIPNRIKRLGIRLNDEMKQVFRDLKLNFEPKWFAVSHMLNEKNSASINEISSSLGLTHPGVIQLVNQMISKKLIESSIDQEDKRKRKIQLTEKGKAIFNSIHPVLEDMESSIKEISRITGYDILHVIESVENSLDAKNLYVRIIEKNKKRLLDAVEILRYSPHYKNYFRNLNYEWLEKYFAVEKEDEKILSDPEKEIINTGGEIFFARVDGEIIGTCAVIKVDKKTFELAKMAVTESAKGKQVGKKLALTAVGYAYSKGAKSIILETNVKLQAAIKLYESLGFRRVPNLRDSKYNRPTFRMELILKE